MVLQIYIRSLKKMKRVIFKLPLLIIPTQNPLRALQVNEIGRRSVSDFLMWYQDHCAWRALWSHLELIRILSCRLFHQKPRIAWRKLTQTAKRFSTWFIIREFLCKVAGILQKDPNMQRSRDRVTSGKSLGRCTSITFVKDINMF